MTTLCRLVLLCVLVALTGPAFAAVPVEPPTAVSIPEMESFNYYPVMSGPLTASDMAAMRLHPARLPFRISVLNYNKDWSSRGEDLMPGTLVLVDTLLGEVRYKADCGNRLVVIGEDVFQSSKGGWIKGPKGSIGPEVEDDTPEPPKQPVLDPLPIRFVRSFWKWFWFAPAN